MNLETRETWVCGILVLPLTSYVTWGKLLNISEPQFPYPSKGATNFCRDDGEIMRDL